MTALGLGDVAAFPFVEPPDRRADRATASRCSRARRARPDAPDDRASGSPTLGRRAGPAAGRPAAGPHGARGRPQRLPARGAGHRRRAVDPGPARAAGRQAAGGRRSSTRRFARPERSDFLAYLNLWSYLREQQQALSVAARSAGCAAPSSSTTCGCASGRTCTASCARSCQDVGIDASGDAAPASRRRRPHPPVAARRAAVAHRAARRGTSATTSAPAAPGSRIFPGSALFKKPAALGDGGRAGRDLPAVGARSSPGSSPSGSSRWPGTWSSAPTASRTGRRKQGAVDGHERVTLYGVPLVAAPHGAATAGSTRELSRELFIRHALVEGDWDTHHAFFHDNRALLRRGRGAGAPGPPARHRRRRRDAVRLLRRSGSGRRRVRRGTSTRWWKDARASRPGPARPSPTRCCSTATAPSAVDAATTRTTWTPGRARAAADLPVRAGRGRRRRHRPRPAAGAQPGADRRASTGRCPGCARSWSPR